MSDTNVWGKFIGAMILLVLIPTILAVILELMSEVNLG